MNFFVIIATVTNINRPDPATPEPFPAPPPPIPLDEPAPLAPATPPKKSKKQGGCLPWVIAIAILITGYSVWKFPSFKAQAELGASYAARIGCSCRYVQGRDINSCETDFEPGMELVSLTDDPETQSVTGRVPLLATRTARFAGPTGCLLQPED